MNTHPTPNEQVTYRERIADRLAFARQWQAEERKNLAAATEHPEAFPDEYQAEGERLLALLAEEIRVQEAALAALGKVEQVRPARARQALRERARQGVPARFTEQGWVTFPEAADLLGVSVLVVRALTAAGYLYARREGAVWKVSVRDVSRLLEWGAQ